MEIYRIDPIRDDRWDKLLKSHSSASVFHTRAWLQALSQTYGYQPVVFTTSDDSEPAITNGILFCRIQSWLTGSRLVSIPFADHCRPLFHADEDRQALAEFLPSLPERERCDYIELRALDTSPLSPEARGLTQSATFAYHILDLTPDLGHLFSRFHKSCFQRKIRRAEREGLSYAVGASDELLDEFYSLLLKTRRRHGVPPQPTEWFRNLRDTFGGALKVRMASVGKKAIAGIVTLRHKSTVVYKYGGSDAAYHRLGGVPFLFWHAIQEEKAEGIRELDLGRSDADGPGLIAFKDHMGASSARLTYYRYPATYAAASSFTIPFRNRNLAAYLPDALLKAAGSFLYRHIG